MSARQRFYGLVVLHNGVETTLLFRSFTEASQFHWFCVSYAQEADKCAIDYTPVQKELVITTHTRRTSPSKVAANFLLDQRAIENMVRSLLWARLQYAHRWVSEAVQQAYERVRVYYGHQEGAAVFQILGMPPKHVGQYWQGGALSKRWQAIEAASGDGKLTASRVQTLVHLSYSNLPKSVRRAMAAKLAAHNFD